MLPFIEARDLKHQVHQEILRDHQGVFVPKNEYIYLTCRC
jgi:hypothetical protein